MTTLYIANQILHGSQFEIPKTREKHLETSFLVGMGLQNVQIQKAENENMQEDCPTTEQWQ